MEPLSLGQQFSANQKIISPQNAIASLFAILNMFLNFFVLAIIHERVPPYDELPDLSFDILPKAAWGLDVAEYIISIQAFLVLILLFLHRFRIVLFRRLCVIMGVIYLLRAICMASTQVPLIHPIKFNYCAKKMDPDQRASWSYYLPEIFRRVFHMMWGFGLSINGQHVYCGDYIFSGHTVTLTFFYLFLREYMVPKQTKRSIYWGIFNTILLGSSVGGVILILVARGHYLIDVIIAYFVTTTTFFVYHTIIYHRALRQSNQKNHLSMFWWWPLMKYLECDHIFCSSLCPKCETITLEVPRAFSWPFSWPRFSEETRSTSLERLLNQA